MKTKHDLTLLSFLLKYRGYAEQSLEQYILALNFCKEQHLDKEVIIATLMEAGYTKASAMVETSRIIKLIS
jgi:hypothetical protein